VGISSEASGRGQTPFGIFINYRRSDSAGYAGRIYDTLRTHSEAWRIFRDIDTIEPGLDFAEVINRSLESCDVVIAVIGPQWLESTDSRGRRRLEHPDDLVRLELVAALERENVRVIPVLVQGAKMPESDDLPDDLAKLARRRAWELSDERWPYDIGRMIDVLDRVQRETEERATAGWALPTTQERSARDEAKPSTPDPRAKLSRRSPTVGRAGGRGVAAAGVGLLLAAIWVPNSTRYGSSLDSYWSTGDAIPMLLVTVPMLLMLGCSVLFRRRMFDLATAALGLVALGDGLVYPLVLPGPFDSYNDLLAGSYLACAAPLVIVVGAVTAVGKPRILPLAAARRNALLANAVAALGLALFFSSIWLTGYGDDVTSTSVWDLATQHRLGIFMAILALLGAFAFLAMGWIRNSLPEIVVAAGGYIALGIGIAFALGGVTGLHLGAALAFVGPMLVAAGALGFRLGLGTKRARVASSSLMILGGVLLAVSSWRPSFGDSGYWNAAAGHSSRMFLLVLAILSGAVILKTVTDDAQWPGVLAGALGLVVLGFCLSPIIIPGIGDGLSPLGPGLALLLAGSIALAGGATLSAWDTVYGPRHHAATRIDAGDVIAIGGLVLALAALWLPGRGGYLQRENGGLMLFLVVLCLLALLGRFLTRESIYGGLAAAVALVLLGFSFQPVVEHGPRHLGVEEWLGFVGSILLVSGGGRQLLRGWMRPLATEPSSASVA
jgi:TIR domain